MDGAQYVAEGKKEMVHGTLLEEIKGSSKLKIADPGAMSADRLDTMRAAVLHQAKDKWYTEFMNGDLLLVIDLAKKALKE